MLLLTCNIALLVFDSVEKLQTYTKLGFKLQDVKSLVFSIEILKLFHFQVLMDSFDQSVSDMFFDNSLINFMAK